MWFVGYSLRLWVIPLGTPTASAFTNTAGDCSQRAGIHALNLTSIRRIKIYGPVPQSPCVLALMFTVHQHDLSEGQEYTISLLFNSMIFATSANKPFLRCKSLASQPTVSAMIQGKPVLIADFSPVFDSSLSANTNFLP